MNHKQNGLQLKKKTQNLSASHSDTRGTDGSNSQQIDWRWNVKVVSLALQVGGGGGRYVRWGGRE